MKIHQNSIHRHGILLFFKISRFILFLIPIGLLFWITCRYHSMFQNDIINFVFIPILLISINYVFLQLTLNSIDYY